MPTIPGTGLSRHSSDDGGFTLVEVVVAMVVLAIGAAAALSTFVAASGVTRNLVQRTAAANLLTRQIEAARAVDTLAIADGRQVSTQTVSGTTFTVTQDVSYVTPGSASTVCTGSGNSLAYKLITVSITWPGMGSTHAVRGDTLKAVGVGRSGFDPSTGSLAVLVAGADGSPASDVQVTLAPGGASETTGADGCAVFPALAPGTYTAAVSTPGYVGTANTMAATLPNLAVAAQSITRGTLDYDQGRSLDVGLSSPAGAVVPPELTPRIGDAYVPETSPPACPASGNACTHGLPGRIDNLFPEVYDVSLGACTASPRSTASVDLRGTTPATSVTVPVGTVDVDVRHGGASLAGRTVVATRAAGPGCPSGETLTLPATDAGGTELVLPYGTWTLTTANGVLPAVVVLSPSNPTDSATLVVTS
jgi:prepilin-type N-terminal cleavage/methylation domain-containing protein